MKQKPSTSTVIQFYSSMWQSYVYIFLLFLCIHYVSIIIYCNLQRIDHAKICIIIISLRYSAGLWKVYGSFPDSAPGKKYAVTRLCSRHELSRASLRFLRVATRETENVEGWKKDGGKGKKWRRRREKTVVETCRDVERNNDSRCRRVRRSELVISHSAMR